MFDAIGGRKMFIALIGLLSVSLVAIFRPDLPLSGYLDFLKWVIIGTSGAIALEDGLKGVNKD